MTAKIYSYFRIFDAKKQLADLYNKKKQSVIFIVPTTLDKDALTDIITDEKSVFGERPILMTFAELYKKLAAEEQDSRRVIDPPDHKLILKYILNEYIANCDQTKLPVGMKHKGFISLLSDNIHTLIREAVTPNLLYEKSVINLSDYAPETILHNLYKLYLQYLDKERLIDSIQTPDKLAQLIEKGGEAYSFMQTHTLAVVGFSSFTGNQLKFFKQMQELFALIYFMPRTGIVDKFRGGIEQLGFTIGNQQRLSTTPLNIKKLIANGQNLEFNAIAREIALAATGESALFEEDTEGCISFGQIGILCTPNSLDTIENELKRYKLPYFVSLRGTVGDTPLGKFPSLIWNAKASGWDTEETTILFSDPFLSPFGFPQREFIKRFVHGETAWREALTEITPEKTEQFDAILQFCEKISKAKPPVEILEDWKEFLTGLNIAQNAAKLAKSLPQYDFTVKNLAHALKELDKKISALTDNTKYIGAAQDVKYSAAEAIDYIVDWATTATLPIQLPQKDAIALYGATPPTFTQHDFWIMTDADGNSWPGKPKESPLLRKEQLELINKKDEEEIDLPTAHIPTLREQREQKEIMFRRLLATARNRAIVAISAIDTNGRPIPETPLLAQLAEKERNNFSEAPWNILENDVKYTLANAMPKFEDESFSSAEISEDTPQNDRGIFPRVAHFMQDFPSISLSALDKWIACQYRYWCNLMRLEQWQSDSFNHILAGNLTHKIWELYWKTNPQKRGTFTDFIKTAWNNDTVQQEYKALFSDRLERYLELLKEQTQNVAVLFDIIEPKAKEAGRIEVKAEFELKDTNGNDFEIDGVKIRGKVDRIDIYPNKKAVILDYKLSKSERHKDELQLAAYGYLLKELYDYDIIGYAWVGHKDGKLCGYFTDEMKHIYAKENTSKIFTEDELKKQLAEAEEKLKLMVNAVNNGEYKAEYDKKGADKKSVCTYCEYSSICRKREAPGYIEESEETS